MSYSFFDHTGDIGVRATSPTLDGLFRDFAAAFTDAVTDPARVERRRSVSLALSASDLELLLVDWLNELLYRFDAEQFLTAAVEVHVDEGDPGRGRSDAVAARAFSLQATLTGEPFDARRHGVKVLVKAITYHALEVRHDAGGWQGTVVFDI